ncbi:MAG: hypothetical protein RIS70_1260 [Planctomycetota bacterium]
MSKEKTTQAKEQPNPASAERPSEGRPSEAREKGSEAPASEASRAVKRILLVDDDGEIIEAIKFALENKGYEVLVARDGNQGLAIAEREDPDLMILDMMMPKRSGFLVLEKLRRTRPVPMRIIMITANEGSRHKAYAEMLGVDDYLRKPFAMDRLVESVGRLLAG